MLAAVALVLASGALSAASHRDPAVPPAVDPGTPAYVGPEQPVPPEPVTIDPTEDVLKKIYEADRAAGGESYWIDRILERPAGGNGGNALYTKGRALYMYTHAPGVLGFAGQGTGANQGGGGFGYREPIAAGVTNLYTVTIAGVTLAEDAAQRRQYPSHWSSVHTADGLRVGQRKFITHDNVAVTVLTLTNTGSAPASWTLTAATPGAVTQVASADGTERTGTFNTRYNLTTVRTRFSGDGFTTAGDALAREVSAAPGESVTVRLQLGALAAELPESTREYERYRGYGPESAFRTHLAAYNEWWVDNPIPAGWHHVAVTRSGTTVTVWVDGNPVAANANVTLSPSSMGSTTNNWIGRSQYGDPLLRAEVDDFQIHDRAAHAGRDPGADGGSRRRQRGLVPVRRSGRRDRVGRFGSGP